MSEPLSKPPTKKTGKYYGGGRKLELTPETKHKLLTALKATVPRVAACVYAGISRATFYRWMKYADEQPKSNFAKFKLEVEEAEQHALANMTLGMYMDSKKDWRARAWIMERRWPKDWGKRETVTHEGLPPAQSYDLSKLTPMEWQQMKALREKMRSASTAS